MRDSASLGRTVSLQQPDAKKARTEGDKPAAADSSKVKVSRLQW
jgi:hypothetical protein